MLTIDGLTKTFRGGVRAIDGVHLTVGDDEVFGLLGHNGAGKTTLVNQVVGLLAPTRAASSWTGTTSWLTRGTPAASARCSPRPRSPSPA